MGGGGGATPVGAEGPSGPLCAEPAPHGVAAAPFGLSRPVSSECWEALLRLELVELLDSEYALISAIDFINAHLGNSNKGVAHAM